MKISRLNTHKPRIEMLPLIDIVFLLLVFFIYAMVSMAVHRGLPVALPTSSSAGIDKSLLLSVTVKTDGKIYVDQEAVTLDQLANTLTRKTGADTKSGVLLFADRNLTYQNLFRVLDQVRTAGIQRISLQAEVNP